MFADINITNTSPAPTLLQQLAPYAVIGAALVALLGVVVARHLQRSDDVDRWRRDQVLAAYTDFNRHRRELSETLSEAFVPADNAAGDQDRLTRTRTIGDRLRAVHESMDALDVLIPEFATELDAVKRRTGAYAGAVWSEALATLPEQRRDYAQQGDRAARRLDEAQQTLHHAVVSVVGPLPTLRARVRRRLPFLERTRARSTAP